MLSSPGQITVYPANRLEDLAVLLDSVLNLAPGGTLSPGVVLVESKGMQHWVSMALARSRGICMNTQFPMPGVFIWQLVRKVLGAERVPLESSYQREALTWRIDRLLGDEALMADPRFADVTRYWRGSGRDDRLKRFQLAAKQADLFEQYLLFRPDWILSWEEGGHDPDPQDHWQAALWRALVAENPNHPVRLQREAVAALGAHRDKLPPQVCLFSINTLPPSTLAFFDRLARYTQVHLFHLNPCVEYWGNLQSEKQLAAQQARAAQANAWLEQNDEGEAVGNPLLANLGGQGKEFFAALQGLETFEISAFDLPEAAGDQPGMQPGHRVLQRVQQDILTLRDARREPEAARDDSITVSASHSALRELQALHDWLLHRFNDDPTLTPRDVLVMCPQVEHYAPYVAAVFDSGQQGGGDPARPRLPVSITDRSPKDAEPLISSFLELLQLPDSRFQVSAILDLLRLPSLQQRFGFSSDELVTLEWWLREACIHWGLDGNHKARLVAGDAFVEGAAAASELFSWGWGLRRLLLGFAHGDQAELVADDWLLPHVEGSDALLLGRLMLLLERLQLHARALGRPRTPAQWGTYLHELREAFFLSRNGDGEPDAQVDLAEAINQLLSWTERVGYQDELPLEVVRHYLNHSLGVPDPSNRFMTGQVTFCSMEPMRSAPFRVIAILGLNDGEYPRPEVPFGFDLMAARPRRAGDRSRRGDDRYLFLEALLCAREHLYLSYQGADIKNNSPRQPSLVLIELMDYLTQGYGWSFAPVEAGGQLQRQPLHPFSPDNFKGAAPSFDDRWLALGTPREARDNRIVLDDPESAPEILDIEALVRFFDNPPRAFAEQRLGLALGGDSGGLEDAEPFDADGLAAFQGRDALLAACLEESPQAVATLRETLRVSGHLPDSHRAEERLDEWEEEAMVLAAAVIEAGGPQRVLKPVELDQEGLRISAQLPLVEAEGQTTLLLWRPARIKPKDRLRLWLYHLCAQAAGLPVTSLGIFLDPGKPGAAPTAALTRLPPRDDAPAQLAQLLKTYREGLRRPLLLNASLGLAVCAAQYQVRKGVAQAKPDAAAARREEWARAWDDGPFGNPYGAGQDPYVRWFWPEGASLDDWWEQLEPLYAPANAAFLGLDGTRQEEQK